MVFIYLHALTLRVASCRRHSLMTKSSDDQEEKTIDTARGKYLTNETHMQTDR